MKVWKLFMEKNTILDEEVLYRAVLSSYPNAIVNGKATPALFMDNGGASVERDGEREEFEIIEVLKQRFFRRENCYKAAAKISAKDCRSVNTFPIATGNVKNVYHAEIHDSEHIKPIGLVKAIQLASLCEIL